MTGAYGGELLYGLLSGMGATLGLGMIWRVCQNVFAHPADEQQSIRAILLQAVRIPVYLCIVVFGLRVMLAEGPDFASRASWLVAADLFLSFFACIGVGEILFGLGIDYYLRVSRGTEVPTIFKQLLKAIIYLIVGLSFLSTTYRIDITPLLTTSAIFSMVIGLALQDVLSNFFAGLSVHISPPFKIGDWVKVGGFFGRVTESNWRATTLQLSSGESVTLPNNDISKKDILNCSARLGCIMQEFNVGLGYDTSPETARRCLYAALEQAPRILKTPEPKVYM
ncbi:MAG TPA: mechanosensitive ion channel, partial [Candidatus Ozemobacteraceae bacterium]|nr:mechanosensitive ion channel [Candidatus Ozemobacteraceae bacterium]